MPCCIPRCFHGVSNSQKHFSNVFSSLLNIRGIFRLLELISKVKELKNDINASSLFEEYLMNIRSYAVEIINRTKYIVSILVKLICPLKIYVSSFNLNFDVYIWIILSTTLLNVHNWRMLRIRQISLGYQSTTSLFWGACRVSFIFIGDMTWWWDLNSETNERPLLKPQSYSDSHNLPL